jgi:hypothetical protein
MNHKKSFLVLFIVILAFIHTEKVKDNNYIENSDLIFLGVDHFRTISSYFAFNAYFAPNNDFSFSNMTFPIFINYDTPSKESEKINMKCSSKGVQAKTNQRISYRCETNEIKRSIARINIIPDFNFIPDKTPRNINEDDNIIPYNVRNISYRNVSIYVVHDISFTKIDTYKFLMKGRVSHEIPIYDYQPITLLAETTDGADVDLEGFIYKERALHYTIRCHSNATETVELDDSIGFIDEENLLLYNFTEDADHTIDLYFDFKKNVDKGSGHIKAGLIVFLVLGIVLSIIAFITALILGKKVNREKYLENKDEPSIAKINNIQ